jgi:hypothetical protein
MITALLHTRDNIMSRREERTTIFLTERRQEKGKEKQKERDRKKDVAKKKKKKKKISSNRNKHDIHTHACTDRDPTEFTNNNSIRMVSHNHL